MLHLLLRFSGVNGFCGVTAARTCLPFLPGVTAADGGGGGKLFSFCPTGCCCCSLRGCCFCCCRCCCCCCCCCFCSCGCRCCCCWCNLTGLFVTDERAVMPETSEGKRTTVVPPPPLGSASSAAIWTETSAALTCKRSYLSCE